MAKYKILVVGSGSVGQRHAMNFSALGCRISCVDPRQDRRDEISQKVNMVSCFPTMEEAMVGGKYDGVIVCSPPLFHEEQAVFALNNGSHVYLEKPVGISLAKSKKLEESLERANGINLLLGYTWRWWSALRYVKALIEDGVIGQIYHARFFVSAHLSDWHPWEPYQEFFMAHKDLGGGALLDESHWIDQMIWMLDIPEAILATVGKVSDLEIDSDDSVDLLAIYDRGLKVSIHLDLFGRPHEKSILFVGSDGRLVWEEKKNHVELITGATENIKVSKFNSNRNDMFMAAGTEFMSVIGGAEPTTCKLSCGFDVMRVIEAVRVSHIERRLVKLSEISF